MEPQEHQEECITNMTPQFIIIHHSAHEEDVPIETIDKWHKERGFKKVGYHYYVRKNGKVEVGREETEMGAHCKAGGMNRKSIGICLAGNFTKQEPTEEQIKSTRALVWSISHRFDIEGILGHKDVKGASTLCPAFDVDIVNPYNT